MSLPIVNVHQINIDRALSPSAEQKDAPVHKNTSKLKLLLREAKHDEETRLCIDIDDCLWLHGENGRTQLNVHLLKVIAAQHALGRDTTLITNRSEVSVFEEAIKCKMSGQPQRERATTTLFSELKTRGFGHVTQSLCFKYTPHLHDAKMQSTQEHIAKHELTHIALIEEKFKTTRWKLIRNDEKLTALEGGQFVSKTKAQLLTDLLKKRIKVSGDISDPEKNLRKAYATFALFLEESSNASFPDLIKALSREYSEDIVIPIIRDLYKVIFENCARAHFPEHFQSYDAVATKTKDTELNINGHRVFGRGKAFSIRFLQALVNKPNLRCVHIDDNWKYVCSALDDAGMEYVHINPKNPQLACEQLLRGLMTAQDRVRAEEIIERNKSFPTRCQDSLFSVKGAVAVSVAALAVGTAVYKMRGA